ncbi:hypothetical protein AURDEDRAFT_167559 [Auricularia subglabra TFB-10046 SS5]|nr:hypothetical protein AURDEDRAFT_167559 [Auricularia subglabra TFB-10046 SS5]
MRGRPRIHDDDKARKRAYYKRHADEERQKARLRWHTRKDRQNAALKAAEEKESALAAFLPATCLLLGKTLQINNKTNLRQLHDSLSSDLCGWRIRATDNEEFAAITNTALTLLDADAPAPDMDVVLERGRGVCVAVGDLAAVAERLAWKLHPERAVEEGSVWHMLAALERQAQQVSFALEEIAILYREAPATLRENAENGSLVWHNS